MKAINWLNIQLTQMELNRLNEDIREPVSTKNFLEKLVLLILEDYPWDGRPEKIVSFHPKQFYENGQWISLSIHDKEQILPPVLQIAQVIQTELAENPVQGRFQVLHLDVNGVQAKLACGIPDAPFPETKIDKLSSEQRDWLAKWIVNAYSDALQHACSSSISKGELHGNLFNGLYIPMAAKMLDTTADLIAKELPASQSVYKKIWQKLLLFVRNLFRRGK